MKRWVTGLASGSSADGVDAALIEIEGVGMDMHARPLLALHQPHPPPLRELLLQVMETGECQLRQVSLLHRLLGETYANATRQVADRASFSLSQMMCIGSPGHTTWHETEGQFPSTLALGMPAVIAERTGVTTISDFRSRDLAAGGEGMPLTAVVDYLLFGDSEESRLIIHLGGIARVIWLPAGGKSHQIIAFEAAPCNRLLDALMLQVTGGKEAFDPGGKHAVQGRCLEGLLKSWLSNPALRARPPKSLPRHRFGSAFAAEAIQQAKQADAGLHDLLCTATHFVARGVIDAIDRFLPKEATFDQVLLSGGGARNGLLWHLFEQQFMDVPVSLTDAMGVSSAARQALGHGILAALTLDGVPASLPTVTGAVASRLLGSITPGNSTNWARCLAWMNELTERS